MRFSLWTSLSNPWADVTDAVAHAEATGWDGVYVADHFMGDGGGFGKEETPNLESTAALAAFAASTSRLRLAPLVLGITYRHPAVLAKWASTVDHVSGGRFVLGVGAGWQENEHRQYGIPLGTPGERLRRFEEALRILRGLLTQERTTVEGSYFQVRDALAEPKPVQSPLPILVGGKGDRMLRIVARHADEWNLWSTPELFTQRSAALDAACEADGRDPASIRRSTQALWFLLDDDAGAADLEAKLPRPVVAGTPGRIVDVVGRYVEAGVDELIVPDFTLGTGSPRADALDTIIERVAPQFR